MCYACQAMSLFLGIDIERTGQNELLEIFGYLLERFPIFRYFRFDYA